MRINIGRRNGQTIIEGVVALGLIVVVLTALSVIISSSINNSTFIKNQQLASKYASQGLETVRYLRNNRPPAPTRTFDTLAAQTSAYCMCANGVIGDNNCTSGQTATGGCIKVEDFSGVLFKREISFVKDSPACSGVTGPGLTGGTSVKISVYWTSGKCSSADRYCHKSELVSCFSNPSASGQSL